MLVIPTKPVANQSLGVVLAQQPCTINLYAKGQFDYAGLYADLYVNNVLILGGAIGVLGVRIVRSAYLGFAGDLAFFDTNTQAPMNPLYTGLGSRWFLAWLDPVLDVGIAPLN